MPTTYTNRKGKTYTLYQGLTSTGKLRYYFGYADKDHAEPVMELPPGYKISESVNGIVSLVKERPSPIQQAEIEVVEAEMDEHPQATRYRVVVKQKQIVIYESSIPDFDILLNRLHISGSARLGLAEKMYALEERHAHFSPELRFILLDPATREFGAERWCYRSSVDGWLKLIHTASLKELARTLIPTLGTDQFFELY